MAKANFTDILSRMDTHLKSLDGFAQRLDAHNASLELTASVLSQKLDAIEARIGELTIAAGPAQPVAQPVSPASPAQILGAALRQ